MQCLQTKRQDALNSEEGEEITEEQDWIHKALKKPGYVSRPTREDEISTLQLLVFYSVTWTVNTWLQCVSATVGQVAACLHLRK